MKSSSLEVTFIFRIFYDRVHVVSLIVLIPAAMTIPDALTDLITLGPIAIVSLSALIVVVVEALVKRTESVNCWISLVGLVAALAVGLATLGQQREAFFGMVTMGGYASFFATVFCASGILSVMLSRSYLAKEQIEHGEFYALLLIAVVGMMLMAAAADLVVFFLGLETMSVSFYVLAGFARGRAMSNEAALKYFLLGSFATGFLLYGIALLYGSASTTNIPAIASRSPSLIGSPLFLIGLGFLLVGLAFKVAAVPFHMWVPDVYDGAPTTVSGFMSTGGKAAAFSAILLIFSSGIVSAFAPLREVLAVIAALSMIVGNLIAVAQSSVKRMLAYSSIAHAGYILVGVVAANVAGRNGVLFYLAAYTMMKLGAFGVVSVIESRDGRNLSYDDYSGLSVKNPFLAGLMALFMFSLTGVPPFAGFFGKYYVFAGAIQAGYTWLAILGVLMSVVSAYYYLRLVVYMYFREQTSQVEASVSKLGLAALVISAFALVEFGVLPSTVLDLTARFF